MSEYRTWQHADWLDELTRRFGDQRLDVAFRCPVCNTVATARELFAAGAPPEALAQDCIGRHDKTRGCDYAAYGLIRLGDTVELADGQTRHVFPMAPAREEVADRP